jgi:hypothetical protein
MTLAAVNVALLCTWLLAELVPLLADAIARHEAGERDGKR